MTNLLLIDTRVKDIEFFCSCLTPNTEYFVFDYDLDTFETIQAKITGNYENIGIVQHNDTYKEIVNTFKVATDISGEFVEVFYDPSINRYVAVSGEIVDISQLITNTHYVKKWKFIQNMGDANVEVDDGDYSSWGDFFAFLDFLKTRTQHLDLLACNLWRDRDWVNIIQYISANYLSVRASSNNTGGDGDFVLESDDFSMIDVYFTDKVLGYPHALDNEYTVTQTQQAGGNYNFNAFGGTGIINVSDCNTLLAVGYDTYNTSVPAIYYSPNNGDTWLVSSPSNNNRHALRTGVISANSAYVVAGGDYTDEGVIYRYSNTTNDLTAYRSITPQSTPMASNIIYKLFMSDSGQYVFSYAATTQGSPLFYISTDYGVSWNAINMPSLPNNYYFRDIAMTKNSKKIIAVVSSTTINNSTIIYKYDLEAAGYGTSGTWSTYTPSSTNINTYEQRMCVNYDGSIIYLYGYILGTNNYGIWVIKNVFGTPSFSFVDGNFPGSYGTGSLICSGNGRILAAYSPYFQQKVYVSLDEGYTFTSYSLTRNTGCAIGMNYSGSYIYVVGGQDQYGYLFMRLEYNTSATPSITIPNGYFTSPALSTNSYSITNPPSWTTSANTSTIAVVNQSNFWGTYYTPLPAGVTQWLSVANTNPFTSSISQSILFNQSGIYRVSFYNARTDNDLLVQLSFNNIVAKRLVQSVYFVNVIYDCLINPSNKTLLFDFIKTTSTARQSIFLTGVSVSYVLPNVVINNGYFTYPSVASGSVTTLTSPYSNLYNWKLSTTGGVNIYISNQSAVWGFPTPLPTGVSQFMIIQYGTVTGSNGGTTTMTQDIYIDTTGVCVVEYYITCRNGTQPTGVINFGASIGGATQSSSVSATSWEKRTISFMNSSVGLKTLTLTSSYTSGTTDSSIFLSGISIANYYATAPDPPTINSLTAGNRQIIVSFTAPANNGGDTITNYKYSLNGGAYISAGTTSSPFTITGLAINTAYTVSIKASNSIGDSNASNSLSATTPDYPSTPTLVSTTGGNRQIVVVFTAPASNGGSAITGYKYSLNGGAFLNAGSAVSPFTITGLAVNTTYAITIKATTVVGDSQTASNSLSATTFDYPSTPTLVSLTEGNTQLTVAFTAPTTDGGSAITDYKYSLNGGAFLSAGSTVSPFIISGLTKQITYSVLLKATTAVGDSQTASNQLSATPYGIPDRPTISVITGANSVIISSISGGNGGRAITSYSYSLDGMNYTSTGNTSIPITIGGLFVGEGYYVSVKATNIAGDSLASIPFYVLAGSVPDPPTILSAQSSANQELLVYFVLPSNDGSTPITDVKYSLNGGAFVSAGSLASPLTISGLTNGQTYSVSLLVSNIVGNSAASNTATETISTLPTSPIITSITPANQQLSVAFSPPSSNGYSPILYYMYSLNGGGDISANTTTSPYTIVGLTNGTSYSVRLRAVNRMGTSAYSAAVSSTPYTTASKPVLTGLVPSFQTLTIYYSLTTNGGSAITDTKYSLNGQSYVSSGDAVSPIVIGGLVNGTPYTVKLKVSNAAGDSVESDASYVYLSYSYNYNNPVSVETNGEVFVMTLRNELNGATHYKYSYDGIQWTSQSLPSSVLSNVNPYGVKWTGNQFLMCGNISSGGGNVLMKSANGEDFSILRTTLGNSVYDVETNVEYNHRISFPPDTTLVFGGDASDNVKIAYSRDAGTSWSAASNSAEVFTTRANGGAWNGKKWVAVGEGATPVYDVSSQTWTKTIQSGHTIATSADGLVWVGRGKSVFSRSGNAVDWNRTQNLFVAVGDGSDNSIASSYDGVYWHGHGKSAMEAGNDVKTNGEMWVAVGRKMTNTQKTIAYSYDGKTWQVPTQTDLFAVSADSVYWNGTAWVAFGTDASYNVATSVDGVVWTMIYDASFSPSPPFFNGTQFLKIANGQVSSSPDGTYWSAPSVISGLSSPQTFAWNRSNEGAAVIQPITLALGDGANTMAYSNDGIYWTSLGNSVFSVRGNAAAWNGEKWVAVGTGGCWCATSYDGIAWSQLTGNALFTEAHDVKWNGHVFVAAGEGANRICVSTDGVHWSFVSDANVIFNTRASCVVWTGKVWLAYGSGGNTTAISSDVYGRIWTPTSTPNMCVSDVSSVIQSAYGNNISATPSAATFYAGWNETGYEPYRMLDGSANTYYRTNGGFSSQTGWATGNTATFTFTNDASATGHPIIVDAGGQIAVKGYYLSFPILSSPQNTLREWILVGISGEDVWNNLLISPPYSGTVIHKGSLETLPQSPDGKYTQYIPLGNHTATYRIYVLLLTRSFSQSVALSGFDMFMYNSNSTTISKYMRPVVSQCAVFHPNPIVLGENVHYVATDLSNAIFSSHNIPSPQTLFSEYGTNTLYHTRAISGAFSGATSTQLITGCGYDGERLFATTANGKILFMSNGEQHGSWAFDTSLNGGVLSSNLPTIRACCHNNNFVILGGSGGSVITYNTMENGAETSWYGTNAGALFTNVYGLASNSAYGAVYSPNTIHFNVGEKLSVITPKANSQHNASIQIDMLKQMIV